MVLVHDCIPCQYGDHDKCMGHYAPAPPGMIGGAMCGCSGECRERAKRTVEVIDAGPPPDFPPTHGRP